MTRGQSAVSPYVAYSYVSRRRHFKVRTWEQTKNNLLEVGANSHDSTMHAPTHPIDRSQCIPSMLASHRRANQSIPCLDRARALTR